MEGYCEIRSRNISIRDGEAIVKQAASRTRHPIGPPPSARSCDRTTQDNNPRQSWIFYEVIDHHEGGGFVNGPLTGGDIVSLKSGDPRIAGFGDPWTKTVEQIEKVADQLVVLGLRRPLLAVLLCSQE